MPSRRSFLAITLAGLAAGCAPAPPAEEDDAGIGGPFSLVDQDGAAVSEAALQGHWTAVYFGYTYCPDVCPTSLMALRQGLDKLGRRGGEVQTLFITVDPARDTPAALKAYLDNDAFPKGTRGLTGTADQIAAVAKAYHLYYAKSGEGPDYLMQHQSIIYVMNPKGRLARPLTHDLSPDEIAKQIGDAMRQKA